METQEPTLDIKSTVSEAFLRHCGLLMRLETLVKPGSPTQEDPLGRNGMAHFVCAKNSCRHTCILKFV